MASWRWEKSIRLQIKDIELNNSSVEDDSKTCRFVDSYDSDQEKLWERETILVDRRSLRPSLILEMMNILSLQRFNSGKLRCQF